MGVQSVDLLIATVVLMSTVKQTESARPLYFTSKNISVTVGESVVLPCRGSTATNTFNWNLYRTETELPKTVAIHRVIVNGFVGRYSVQSSSDADYSLVIRDVELNDTGDYVCAENDGFGPFHHVQLLVVALTTVSTRYSTPAVGTELLKNQQVSPADGCAEQTNRMMTIMALLSGAILAISTLFPLSVVILMRRCGWRLEKRRKSYPGHRSSTTPPEHEAMLSKRYSNGSNDKPCNCKAIVAAGDDTNSNAFKDKCWHDIYSEFELHTIAGRTIHAAMRDFYELLRHPELCHNFMAFFAIQVHQKFPEVEVIIGVDTNGFMVSLLAAQELRRPFIPVRKLRALPGDTYQVKYSTRNDEKGWMAIQKSACSPGQKVVIIDEKLASGGTMLAAVELIKMMHADLLGCIVVIEDSSHEGRKVVQKKYSTVEIVSLFVTSSDGMASSNPSMDAQHSTV